METSVAPSSSASSSALDFCFLCLTRINVNPRVARKPRRGTVTLQERRNRYQVAVKYLIHSCNDTQDKSHQQLELIKKLIGVLNEKDEVPGPGLESGGDGKELLCEKCEGRVADIIKLHRKLELIQLRLSEAVKAIQDLIIGSSVYGSDEEKKKQMEKLEMWIQEQENGGCVDNLGVRKKREWLRTLVEFQTAIFNKSEEKKENSWCPYLNKCNLVPSSCSVFELKTEKPLEQSSVEADFLTSTTDFDISTLVKTEFVGENEDLDAMDLDLSHLPELTSMDQDQLRDLVAKAERSRGEEGHHRKSDKSKRTKSKASKGKSSPQKKVKGKTTPQGRDKDSSHKYATRMAVIVDKERRLRSYKCEICSFSATSMYTFIHHLRSHETDDKIFECKEKECGERKFSGAQFFKLHQLQHVEGQYQWKCKVCLKRISPPEYSKHLKTHGEGPVYPCEFCYYGSKTVVDFVSHLRYHHGVTPKCLFCEVTIPKVAGQSAYAQHLHKEHGCSELVVQCDYDGCKETFYSSYAMHLHKNIHTKKFHCERCTRSFSTSTAYRLHIQERHTKEKVHPCTISGCNEGFVTQPELERHLVTQHNMPKFRCSICPDREYSNMRSLKVHLRRHHQENVYSCDVCQKTFKNIAYCNKHKTIHGPRNVICEVCGFATTSHYQLQKHKVIHKEVPIHGCPHCEKRFNYRRAMEDHIRTHTGERPFVCHYCSAAFAQKGACMNHIRKLHEKDKSKKGVTTEEGTSSASQDQPDPPESTSGMKQEQPQSSQEQLSLHQSSQLESVLSSNPDAIEYDIIIPDKIVTLTDAIPLQTYGNNDISFGNLT